MRRIALLIVLVAALCAVVGDSSGAVPSKLDMRSTASAPTVGPTHSLSVNTLTGKTSFDSTSSTLYYNGNAGGSFTVNDVLTDSVGPKDVTYPLVSTAGWTHPPQTVITAPSFTSSTYSWLAGATTSPGAQSIVGENTLSETSTAMLTIANDTTPPTGQSIALSGGPTYNTPFVPLTLTNGSDTGAGVDPASGTVDRASTMLSGGTCGSFGGYATVTLTSGADTSVVAGMCYRYRYRVSDLVANQSSASAPSATAIVGSAATPGGGSSSSSTVVTIASPTELTGSDAQYYASGTLWFRPTAAGSFNLNATASDPAGITNVAFPSVASVVGWAGSTGGADTSSPYASPVPYTWTANASPPGTLTVTATNGTGGTGTATIAVTPDTTGPTGQTIALSGGPWFTGSISLTITHGTDVGSGVDPPHDVVERASAPLTNGVCGAYGTFTAVTLTGTADKSVSPRSCYRYQVKVSDNVGNVSAPSAATTDAKIDTTPPTSPALTFSGLINGGATGSVVYYRPTGSGRFTVTASSIDPESGVASFTFPTLPGFTLLGAGSSRTYVYSTPPSGVLGPFTVTATNRAGIASGPGSFTLVADSTPPTVTVRCNNAPCRSTVYPKAVTLTISARDGLGSGVDTIRYSTDDTSPTAHDGAEYVNPISVRTLTHLKVRAYDRAGNASTLATVTVRSAANRIVFAAPARLNVGASAKYLQARVTTSRRVIVSAVLTGPGMRTGQRWRFILPTGTSIVQLRLPWTLMRTGRYTLVWHMAAGSLKATRTSHLYRLAARK